MSPPERPEPPETKAVRAGADIELTTTTETPETPTSEEPSRHSAGASTDDVLTTDPAAQRSDLLVELEPSD